MARPHIEFVQVQNVGWTYLADGRAERVLNADPDTGAETVMLRYLAGYRAGAETHQRAEEFFVLDGAVEIDGVIRGRHSYGFLPRGSGLGTRRSQWGAVLLVFRHGCDDPDSAAGTAEPVSLDAAAMPWDVSTYDPKLAHLRLARKVLRLGPNDSGRTFLLTGMPHGVPEVDRLPAETHDHAEEMFMISGEMWAPEGPMRPGAYFYRPPGILHGPHVSETGFLQIMRSPGANRIVTHWSETERPLPIGAAFAPVMPAGTPEEWRRPVKAAACW
jgi:quercetin dioxygenase-like cupin family protein